MLAARQVQREWLDELPADDPRAVRSRRDLFRVNTWMMQPGIMARALLAHHGPVAPRAILDLGSGDGTFMLRVAALLARRWRNVSVTMLDQQDIVEPINAPWVRCARLELQHDRGRFVRHSRARAGFRM